ncbi:MAG: alpha/beta hydrolase [Hyphomonadaceae bacterium]|nr:alpha/beta hydrolase [Hyphomonadaceae bacterium]
MSILKLAAVVLAGALVAACQTAPARIAAAEPAPTLPALRGDYFRLDSAILGRPLHIHVALPDGYERETTSYPAIYITDGDSLFPLLAPTHLFLTYDEPVPPAILVGIAYGSFDPAQGNRRDTDYVAPDPAAPTSAAAAYQRTLAEELIPEIERRYRANPERRILIGQSLGAAFVIHSALSDPDLFWGRIASNPSFRVRRDAYFAPPSPASRPTSLFVASGERDRPQLRADALAWFDHWNAQTPRPWELKTVTISNGTHAASIGEVYRQGMTWLFRNEPPQR